MATDAPSNPARPGRKRLLLGGGAVILLAVLAAGGCAAGLIPLPGAHHRTNIAKSGADIAPVIVDIPDVVTNLDVENQRARFVKLHVRLVVPGAADAASVERLLPQVTDAIQTYLRAVTPQDLEGAEGTYRLRTALLNHLAVTIAPAGITDVLFGQLLVQ